jgi:hypothetical protein
MSATSAALAANLVLDRNPVDQEESVVRKGLAIARTGRVMRRRPVLSGSLAADAIRVAAFRGFL